MKNLIHYVLILDKSGSMQDIKNLSISSFNEQVDRIRKIQKNEPGIEIRVTLCMFNDEVKMVSFFEPIDYLHKLNRLNYQPRSMTALYDAIGYTYHKTRELDNRQQKVIMAIFTDGLENASKEYAAADISRIIESSEMQGWEVRFFCRYEDRLLHKTQLNITDKHLIPMYLNDDGFRNMSQEIEDSVMYCIRNMK